MIEPKRREFFKQKLEEIKAEDNVLNCIAENVENFTITDGKSYMKRQRELIKSLWESNLVIYQIHGIIGLLERGCQLEKRVDILADKLLSGSIDSELKDKIKAHTFMLSLDIAVLEKMIDLYQDNGKIESLESEVLNGLVEQVNKGGRPIKYDHEGITYPMWKAAYDKPNYGEYGQKAKLVNEILEEFYKNGSEPSKRLIENKIAEYESSFKTTK